MVYLFSYGTLRQGGVQVQLFGRELDGTPERIVGYRLDMLHITDPDVVATSGSDQHPILYATGNPTDHVDGTVLVMTEAELAAADAYEVDDYRRVLAPLASGGRAWVYAASHNEG